MVAPINPDLVKKIVTLNSEGFSIEATANQLGLHRRTVRKYVQAAGRTSPYKVRKWLLDETSFATLTEDSAYWVGMLMADGCVFDRNYIFLSTTEQDREHLEKFRTFLKSDYPFHEETRTSTMPGTKRSTPVVELRIFSPQIAGDLKSLGVVPRKSLVASAPEILRLNRDFWRGIVDGDGCICETTNRGRAIYSLGLTGSLSICDQFADFVFFLTGKRPSVYACKRSTAWNCRVSSLKVVRDVLAALYDNCSTALARKEAKARAIIGT
jgi:hypothetical protein